jgi:hypothetical protein
MNDDTEEGFEPRAMNFERLRNAALAVRGAREDKFTMHRIVFDCGTPGCALGWYAYRMDLQSEFRIDACQLRPGVSTYFLSYKAKGSFLDAAAEHFGLSWEQASELFGSWGCGAARTPAEAEAYIVAFIARHENPKP